MSKLVSLLVRGFSYSITIKRNQPILKTVYPTVSTLHMMETIAIVVKQNERQPATTCEEHHTNDRGRSVPNGRGPELPANFNKGRRESFKHPAAQKPTADGRDPTRAEKHPRNVGTLLSLVRVPVLLPWRHRLTINGRLLQRC
jgi:hypothetical protein